MNIPRVQVLHQSLASMAQEEYYMTLYDDSYGGILLIPFFTT